MPGSTTVEHPKEQISLTFTEDDHRYVDSTGAEYTSVTTVAKTDFPKFDVVSAAERVANREGCTVDDVISKWDANRESACDYGTRVHETAEDVLNGLKPRHQPRDEKEQIAFSATWDACQRLLDRWELVETEKLVFSPHARIAGTLDLLMRDPETGAFLVLDWKTNKQLTWEAFRGTTGSGRCAKVPDANLAHYSVQLSLYEFILRWEGYLPKPEYGLPVVHRALMHVAPLDPRVHWYALPDAGTVARGLWANHAQSHRGGLLASLAYVERHGIKGVGKKQKRKRKSKKA
ncbi:MAG: PD-(D/E)XK nuclease family protein [Verrucomicrobiota bacterium]